MDPGGPATSEAVVASAAPSRRRLVIRNIAWLSLERALQFAAGILVGAYVARYLGPTRYGLLAYAVAYTVLLIPLGSAAQSVVVRDLLRRPDREEAILGTATALSALTLALAMGLIAAVGFLSGSRVFHDAAPLLGILAIGLGLRPLQVVDYWFQANLQAKRATLARNAALLTMSLVRVSLVMVHSPVLGFAAAVAGEWVLGTVLQLVLYGRAGRQIRGWRLDRSYFHDILRQAVPLIAASLSVALIMRIDQVMLGGLSTVRQNGLYAIAVTLAESSYFLPVAVVNSLTPGLTQLHSIDLELFYRRLQYVFTVLAAVAYGIVIGGVLLTGPLIRALYGSAYSGSVHALYILLLSAPFVFIGVAQNVWNVLENHLTLSLARSALGGVTNVALNVWLLPRYGALGASITTLVAVVVTSYAGNAVGRSTWPMLRTGTRALLLLDLRVAVRSLVSELRAS